MATWGGQGRKIPQLFEGSAGRAVATGGFWSLTGTGKSLTMRPERPAPRRGAADPNAPCGASTAAPVFGDRRFVQLSACCSLLYLDRCFGDLFFFLRLMCAYFCSYLHVLDVFRYFVSCQAALTFCKCSCREATKIHRK